MRHKIERLLDAADAKEPDITEIIVRFQGRQLVGTEYYSEQERAGAVRLRRHLSRP